MSRNWEYRVKNKGGIFHTFYMRLLLVFSFIIVITLIILGILMGSMIFNQYAAEFQDEMLRECHYINEIMPDWNNPEKSNDVRKELNVISRKYNAAIWIIDRSRNTAITSDPGTQWALDETKVETDPAIDQIFEGKELRTMSFSKDSEGDPVLTVGCPMSWDGRLEGAILMHRRTMDVRENTEKIYRNIAIPACVAVFLTVILISLLVHRFTKPLVEMNKVARSYAKGDFEERVAVTSSDEIGQLAESFNAMANDLQSLEDMRRSFVANVSHELKAPLASMWGFLQAVLDGSVPAEEQQEYLKIVLDETKRLSRLINDLLDFSKVESGELPMKPQRFDINELIARTLITFEGRIESKEIDVQLEFEFEHSFVWGDPERITQVIRNLIDNALKFSYEKGKLILKTSVDNKEGLVYISVQDTGAGIPKEDLAHIWERFYKVDKAHTPGEEGTGLGLAIVKRIIDQHDSAMMVSSEMGKGTSFTFTLPFRAQPARANNKKSLED